MNKYTIAICGATGLVGRSLAAILIERKFPIEKIRFFASASSSGKELPWNGLTYRAEELREDSFKDADFAFFSAGGDISEQYAPIAAANGCIVIDNSSFWRMEANTPLVVPEVNPHSLSSHRNIIANPNCSTIQLVAALKPISDALGLRRVVVSTYQSVSGAGQKGIDQLSDEIAGREPNRRISSHRIAYNTIFHNFPKNEINTEEEIKIINESRKIMELPNLRIAATCVRLPILGGHGESVNIETEVAASPEDIREILAYSPGIAVHDNPQDNHYPTTLYAAGSDDVHVGRIRRDDSVENGFNLWIVADNVRKGAATNAVQIAEEIIRRR